MKKKYFLGCLPVVGALIFGVAQYSAYSQYGGGTSTTVGTSTTSLGTFLVDSQGFSLYIFEADTQGQSNCSGQCAEVWPPLLVTSGQNATASGNAVSAMLGTITRADGSTQVTYNGLPLYRYSVDQSPGDTNGQAINSFGNKWYLMQPNGSPLIPPSYSSSTTSSYGPGIGAFCDNTGRCCDLSGHCFNGIFNCDQNHRCCDQFGHCFNNEAFCDFSGHCCDSQGNCFDGGFSCDQNDHCCDSNGNCFNQGVGGFRCDSHGQCCNSQGTCFMFGGGNGCDGFNCDGRGHCCDSCGQCYNNGPGSNPGPSGTPAPTGTPTHGPTSGPSGAPTGGPTGAPTHSPTSGPTSGPTSAPTVGPTGVPSPRH